MIGVLLGAGLIQQQTLRSSSSYHSEETKKDYYKLLKLKPMFIKLNVSSHGTPFLQQIVNLSMVKEIRGGYIELHGLTPDKWSVAKLIDGEELYVEGSVDTLLSQIWHEQDKTIDVRVRNGSGRLGPL